MTKIIIIIIIISEYTGSFNVDIFFMDKLPALQTFPPEAPKFKQGRQ